MRSYQPGDTVNISGTIIMLGVRRHVTGLRWTWTTEGIDLASADFATAQRAIDDAAQILQAPKNKELNRMNETPAKVYMQIHRTEVTPSPGFDLPIPGRWVYDRATQLVTDPDGGRWTFTQHTVQFLGEDIGWQSVGAATPVEIVRDQSKDLNR